MDERVWLSLSTPAQSWDWGEWWLVLISAEVMTKAPFVYQVPFLVAPSSEWTRLRMLTRARLATWARIEGII